VNVNALAKRTQEGLYWNISLKVLFEIIRFAISIIIARMLDPVDFGIMAIGFMVIYYSNSLSDFGFTNAIVQQKDIEAIHINSVFSLNLFVSLFLTLVTLLMANSVGKYFNSPESADVLLLLSSVFILRTFYDIGLAMLRRELKFKFIAKLGFIQSLIQSIIAILLVLLGFKFWSLAWAAVLSNFIATICLMIKVEWKPKIQYSHSEMRKIYSFGLWNFIRSQIYFINNYAPKIIIGRFLNPFLLGGYEKADSFTSIPRSLIAGQINTVMFSSFSRLQKEKAVVANWFVKIVILETVVILPFLLGFNVIAQYFVIVVLGEKWAMSIQPLQILSIASIFIVLNGLVASLNVAIGLYKTHTLLSMVMVVFLIAFSMVAVRWGIVGICYIQLIISICWFVIIFKLMRNHIPISINSLVVSTFPYVLANLVMFAVVKVLSVSLFVTLSISNLIGLTFIGIVVYILLVISINKFKKRNVFYPIKEMGTGFM
jgi:O-antigen/teichoic acid export membrane protein